MNNLTSGTYTDKVYVPCKKRVADDTSSLLLLTSYFERKRIYGDERISTGILNHDKRVEARCRFKNRNVLKINDKNTTLQAA